jgi:hypothetical protein
LIVASVAANDGSSPEVTTWRRILLRILPVVPADDAAGPASAMPRRVRPEDRE